MGETPTPTDEQRAADKVLAQQFSDEARSRNPKAAAQGAQVSQDALTKAAARNQTETPTQQ